MLASGSMLCSSANLGFVLCFCLLFIQKAWSCFDSSSNVKAVCGCDNYVFMRENGRRAYCGKTRDYHDIFQQSNLPDDVIAIHLTNNEIKSVSENFFPSEMSFYDNIQELSLGENEIEFIADGAFQYFKKLKSLNLTYNRIGRLHQGMFQGLESLERLYLSYNNFPIISGNVFEQLPKLKKVEVNSDYLICNCLMKDFFSWFLSTKPRIKLAGKCRLPLDKRGQRLKTVAKSLNSLPCGLLTAHPYFEISPQTNRVVFAGDKTQLYCEGFDLSSSELSWSLNGRLVNSTTESFNETQLLYSSKSTVASFVNLKLSSHWSGEWKCFISSNFSHDSLSVNLTVLSNETRYCDEDAKSNDYGAFQWPEVVAGAKISLDCGFKGRNAVSPPQATRFCMNGGVWSNASYDDCQYVDPVARTLDKILDHDFNQSAISLCNGTSTSLLRPTITAPLGFKLLSLFFKKCQEYLFLSDDIGRALIKLSSRSMDASSDVISSSQNLYQLQAVDVIEHVIDAVVRNGVNSNSSYYNQSTKNIAVYASKVQTGIHCNISVNGSITSMKCVQKQPSNIKINSPSVSFLPQKTEPEQLSFVIYRNGKLFQSSVGVPTINLKQYEKWVKSNAEVLQQKNTSLLERHVVLVSRVYVVLPSNGSRLRFSKPNIRMIFHTDERVSLRKKLHHVVMWNATQWQRVSGECSSYGGVVNRNLTVIKCLQTGIYAIAKNLDEQSVDSISLSATPSMHPSVYIGASVMLFCLCFVIITYLVFPNLLISRESRHVLVNLCCHLSLALLAFVVGVGRVENQILCYSSGVAIHYSSLSVLIWLFLTARIMSKEMVASQQPPPAEPKPKRPMLRFYLVACGIPLMVCGITAAANIQNYHEDNGKYCWLSWDTSLYAFFVPAALVTVSCVLTLLRILATLNCNSDHENPSRNSHCDPNLINESTPLHQLSSRQPSTATLHKQVFNEQSFGVRLRGAAVTFVLFILAWSCAAFSLDPPFLQGSLNAESQADALEYWDSSEETGGRIDFPLIFSCLLAASASGIGIFLLYQHIASRSDASLHWKRLFRCKSAFPTPGCHGNAIELTPRNKQKNAATISVTEELTLETVAPGTTGEENSLPPSTRGREQRENASDVNIVRSIGNQHSTSEQITAFSNGHYHSNRSCARPVVKLTNLQTQPDLHLPLHESSLTEHSFDESHANMHTIPVILQHNPVKVDNSVLYHRYQKIRKSREAKRKRKQKLTVLREYAHDPLTSNDEGDGGRNNTQERKDDPFGGFNDLNTIDEKMMENLAINEYKKADEKEKMNIADLTTRPLRPLLVSSPNRKKARSEPHRKRPNRDPNIASNYKRKSAASDGEEESEELLLTEEQSHEISPFPSNRCEGLEERITDWKEKKSLLSAPQSHGYLTASAILSNPFHIPTKKSTSSSTLKYSPKNTPKSELGKVQILHKEVRTGSVAGGTPLKSETCI